MALDHLRIGLDKDDPRYQVWYRGPKLILRLDLANAEALLPILQETLERQRRHCDGARIMLAPRRAS